MSDKGLFSIVEGAYAVLRKAGRFRQVNVYARRHGNARFAYAGSPSQLVQLFRSGSTSDIDTKWDALVGLNYKPDGYGYLQIEE